MVCYRPAAPRNNLHKLFHLLSNPKLIIIPGIECALSEGLSQSPASTYAHASEISRGHSTLSEGVSTRGNNEVSKRAILLAYLSAIGIGLEGETVFLDKEVGWRGNSDERHLLMVRYAVARVANSVDVTGFCFIISSFTPMDELASGVRVASDVTTLAKDPMSHTHV